MHILCTELIEVPTALLKWESSAEEIQLAAKDLVQSINSDHIFGNTSLQKKGKNIILDKFFYKFSRFFDRVGM